MKKYSIKLATLALFFATSITVGMEPEINNTIGVYVHNTTKYNLFIEIIPTMSASVGKFKPQIKIIPYDSDEVGRLKDLQDLKISGDYTIAVTSNEQALNRIKNEALRKKNADVYVNVNWSLKDGYHIQSWHWVSSKGENETVMASEKWEEFLPREESSDWGTKSVIFSSEQFEKSFATITLQDVIVNNVLGQEYAKKAMAICDANYTIAKERGASDLCLDLKKMFVTRAKSKEDAMRIIDNIYARLQMYTNAKYRLGENEDYTLPENWETQVRKRQ